MSPYQRLGACATLAEFDPIDAPRGTSTGRTLLSTADDWLVVAAGLQLDWEAVPGLRESVAREGVCSNYSSATVDSTWQAIRHFRGGNAIFTHPSGEVKCGGPPQKITYLADDWIRHVDGRDMGQLIFASALPNVFAVEPYRRTLEQVAARKAPKGN